MVPYPFTKEQYNQILALLKGEGSVSVKPDVAASASLTDNHEAFLVKKVQEWIIDTGATNHMVVDVELLD